MYVSEASCRKITRDSYEYSSYTVYVVETIHAIAKNSCYDYVHQMTHLTMHNSDQVQYNVN